MLVVDRERRNGVGVVQEGEVVGVHEVYAGHLELEKEPYVRLWAERLKESLDRAHASIPPQECRS